MSARGKRIDYSLLSPELQQMFDAGWKIVPLPLSDIENNINPDEYEYVRPIEAQYNNYVYRWDTDHFELLVAQDVEIKWTDVLNKPETYPPENHTHENDHSHTNKSILDSITQALIDTWNTITGKADIDHNHDTEYYTKESIDLSLSGKSDTDHNHTGIYQPAGSYAALEHDHDGRYNTKSEISTLLGQKAALSHEHEGYAPVIHNHDSAYAAKSTESAVSDHETRLSNIEGGYSSGHSHANLSVLTSITQALIDAWNSAVTHLSDTISHITSEERTLWNTVSGKSDSGHNHDSIYPAIEHDHDSRYYTESEIATLLSSKAEATTLSGHTGNTTVHVTATDKNNWNAKTQITQGTVQPTSGYWFKEV